MLKLHTLSAVTDCKLNARYFFFKNDSIERILRMHAFEAASAILKGKRLKPSLLPFLKAVHIFLHNNFLCYLKFSLGEER